MWRSDGTSAGTVMVRVINPGNVGRPVLVNDAIYFSASDVTHGTELWKTDGTTAGTVW